MTAAALDSEYENGVADVLAYLARDAAVVKRNVHLQGRKSHTSRQIDVMVSGKIFGLDDATMIVDCKRYKGPLDVNHVGAFVGLLEDVGADFGLLVTTVGASDAARHLAANERGVRVSMLAVDDLSRWSPRGTIHFDYAVPADRFAEAARAARRAGFRVKPTEVPDWRELPDYEGLTAFRHFGASIPSAEVQEGGRADLMVALGTAGVVEPVPMGNGVVVDGGTPSHRWLEVTVGGVPTELKVLAASEADIDVQLSNFHSMIGGSREALDVIRPDSWPIPTLFPTWSQ